MLNRLFLLRNIPSLQIWSPAFADNGRIPARYTSEGEGLSPPLSWHICPTASSYGLLVEDADAPVAHPLVNGVVVNLSGSSCSLAEGALSSPHHAGSQVDPALHARFNQAWLPPHPAPGEHRYAFQLFALRFGPSFAMSPGRNEFIEAVLEFAIAGGCVIGTYQGHR